MNALTINMKNMGNLVPVLFVAGLLAFLAPLPVSASPQVCVGRYELSLPGSADVALTQPQQWYDSDGDPIGFPDGQRARYSAFFYNGDFSISNNMSFEKFNSYVERTRSAILKDNSSGGADEKFDIIPSARKGSFSWAGARSSVFFLYENNVAIKFNDPFSKLSKKSITLIIYFLI